MNGAPAAVAAYRDAVARLAAAARDAEAVGGRVDLDVAGTNDFLSAGEPLYDVERVVARLLAARHAVAMGVAR